MVAVDTNILVRLFTEDDPVQFQLSRDLFAAEVIYIPYTVLLESEWVLRYAYGFQPAEIAGVFRKLLGLANVHVREPDLINLAIQWHESGVDFANALHLAHSQSCRSIMTFDKKFARAAQDISTCAVTLLDQ